MHEASRWNVKNSTDTGSMGTIFIYSECQGKAKKRFRFQIIMKIILNALEQPDCPHLQRSCLQLQPSRSLHVHALSWSSRPPGGSGGMSCNSPARGSVGNPWGEKWNKTSRNINGWALTGMRIEWCMIQYRFRGLTRHRWLRIPPPCCGVAG